MRKLETPSVLGRLVVDGWAITGRGPLHVNGHANAVLSAGRTVFKLPTDDEIAGGVFVQWFRLFKAADRPTVAIPKVAGQGATVVQKALIDLGLVVTVQREGSNTVRKGFAIRTEPAEGSVVPVGSTVVLVVSDGPLG